MNKVDKCVPNIIPKKWYAITINPSEQNWHMTLRGLQTIGDMSKLLKTFNGINYYLFPEMSEPMESCKSDGPRLHFHGFIQFSSNFALMSFWTKYWRKLSKVSIFLIKEIDNKKGWMDYCEKQQCINNYNPLYNTPKIIKSLELWG